MILVNALPCNSVRLVTPWTGVWFADVDAVLDETGILPFGPCTLTIGTSLFVGTVDPRSSGVFAGACKLRIVGGGGGWDSHVRAQHFHNDAGVLSSMVYAATAAEVLETVVDVLPQPLGIDYVRSSGPASRVLAGLDWYVTQQGITMVGPRLPLPMDPTSAEILSWDPLLRVAEISSDVPISPGTILLDPTRFPAPVIVRDVEQTWAGDGGKATAWCAKSAGSRLQTALTRLVGEKLGVVYLETYPYRVVLEGPDGRLTLQSTALLGGDVPDVLPLSPWFGIPGFASKLLPGSIVLVEFLNKDPTKPVVRGFQGGAPPIESTLDALSIKLGAAATDPVVTAAKLVSALATAVTAASPDLPSGAFKTSFLAAINAPTFLAAVSAIVAKAA